MADFNVQERRTVRAYDSSYIEIVLGVRQFFEKEKQEYRSINLNNIIERIVAATGVNKNIIFRIRTMEDVKCWKKKSGDHVNVRHEQQITTNSSSAVRNVIGGIYLEHTSVPTLYSMYGFGEEPACTIL